MSAVGERSAVNWDDVLERVAQTMKADILGALREFAAGNPH